MNTKAIGKIGLAVFFLALLAAPYFIDRMGDSDSETDKPVNMEEALERHGFFLQEVSQEAELTLSTGLHNWIRNWNTLCPRLPQWVLL